MPAHHRLEPDQGDRPFNNLLRRLNAADFALLSAHLAQEQASSNELLYNPGDDVQTVHFPCGPSLATFMVPNEDGRDVETILVGREGAVGGIVSEGYLPAYTRIMVKFGGPVCAPERRKARGREGSTSATTAQRVRPLRRLHAGTDLPVDRLQRTSTRSSSAPPNGSSRRWSATDDDHRAAHARAACDPARGRPQLHQPRDPDRSRREGDAWRPGAARSWCATADALRSNACQCSECR